MNAMLSWFASAGATDTRMRAILRRSLGQYPGLDVRAFSYVEPFVSSASSAWDRTVHYLVAALWAAHWRAGAVGAQVTLGAAAARHGAATESGNIEGHILRVLDADEGQLPHRLRQLMSLLRDQPVDFDDLLRGLLRWNDPQRRTQVRWARDFYSTSTVPADSDTPSPEDDA